MRRGCHHEQRHERSRRYPRLARSDSCKRKRPESSVRAPRDGQDLPVCPATSARRRFVAHPAVSLRLPPSAGSSCHAGMTASGVKRQRARRRSSVGCPGATPRPHTTRLPMQTRVFTPSRQPCNRRSAGPGVAVSHDWVAPAAGGSVASFDPRGCKHQPSKQTSAPARRRRRSSSATAQEDEPGAPTARSLRDERDHRGTDGGVIATDGTRSRGVEPRLVNLRCDRGGGVVLEPDRDIGADHIWIAVSG